MVDKNYRRFGITDKFAELTTQYADTNKFPFLYVPCTSLYTALFCKAQGYKKVYELKYADYVVDGMNPILPAPPHTAFRIYIRPANYHHQKRNNNWKQKEIRIIYHFEYENITHVLSNWKLNKIGLKSLFCFSNANISECITQILRIKILVLKRR